MVPIDDMGDGSDEVSASFAYLLMLDVGSPVSREAAEAARALVTARLERDDPRLFYAELKRQVNRIFDGVVVAAELKSVMEGRVEWAASLLSAMSVVAEMLVHGSTGLTRAVADATQESPDQKDEFLAAMATPERLVELTFQLAEEQGWTI